MLILNFDATNLTVKNTNYFFDVMNYNYKVCCLTYLKSKFLTDLQA